MGVLEGLKARWRLGESFLEQGGALLVRGGVEVTQGTLGLAVECLARESALPGVPGDGAVLAEDDGRGAGESVERYDTRG